MPIEYRAVDLLVNTVLDLMGILLMIGYGATLWAILRNILRWGYVYYVIRL